MPSRGKASVFLPSWLSPAGKEAAAESGANAASAAPAVVQGIGSGAVARPTSRGQGASSREMYCQCLNLGRDPVYVCCHTGLVSWVLPALVPVQAVWYIMHCAIGEPAPYFENLHNKEVSWTFPEGEGISDLAKRNSERLLTQTREECEEWFGAYNHEAALKQLDSLDHYASILDDCTNAGTEYNFDGEYDKELAALKTAAALKAAAAPNTPNTPPPPAHSPDNTPGQSALSDNEIAAVSFKSKGNSARASGSAPASSSSSSSSSSSKVSSKVPSEAHPAEMDRKTLSAAPGEKAEEIEAEGHVNGYLLRFKPPPAADDKDKGKGKKGKGSTKSADDGKAEDTQWLKRYYVLGESVLTYYDTHITSSSSSSAATSPPASPSRGTKAPAQRKPLGELQLFGDYRAEPCEAAAGQRFVFHLVSSTSGELLRLAASSEEERSRWVTTLSEFCGHAKGALSNWAGFRAGTGMFSFSADRYLVLNTHRATLTVHPSDHSVTVIEQTMRIDSSTKLTFEEKKPRVKLVSRDGKGGKPAEWILTFDQSTFPRWRAALEALHAGPASPPAAAAAPAAVATPAVAESSKHDSRHDSKHKSKHRSKKEAAAAAAAAAAVEEDASVRAPPAPAPAPAAAPAPAPAPVPAPAPAPAAPAAPAPASAPANDDAAPPRRVNPFAAAIAAGAAKKRESHPGDFDVEKTVATFDTERKKSKARGTMAMSIADVAKAAAASARRRARSDGTHLEGEGEEEAGEEGKEEKAPVVKAAAAPRPSAAAPPAAPPPPPPPPRVSLSGPPAVPPPPPSAASASPKPPPPPASASPSSSASAAAAETGTATTASSSSSSSSTLSSSSAAAGLGKLFGSVFGSAAREGEDSSRPPPTERAPSPQEQLQQQQQQQQQQAPAGHVKASDHEQYKPFFRMAASSGGTALIAIREQMRQEGLNPALIEAPDTFIPAARVPRPPPQRTPDTFYAGIQKPTEKKVAFTAPAPSSSSVPPPPPPKDRKGSRSSVTSASGDSGFAGPKGGQQSRGSAGAGGGGLSGIFGAGAAMNDDEEEMTVVSRPFASAPAAPAPPARSAPAAAPTPSSDSSASAAAASAAAATAAAKLQQQEEQQRQQALKEALSFAPVQRRAVGALELAHSAHTSAHVRDAHARHWGSGAGAEAGAGAGAAPGKSLSITHKSDEALQNSRAARMQSMARQGLTLGPLHEEGEGERESNGVSEASKSPDDSFASSTSTAAAGTQVDDHLVPRPVHVRMQKETRRVSVGGLAPSEEYRHFHPSADSGQKAPGPSLMPRFVRACQTDDASLSAAAAPSVFSAAVAAGNNNNNHLAKSAFHLLLGESEAVKATLQRMHDEEEDIVAELEEEERESIIRVREAESRAMRRVQEAWNERLAAIEEERRVLLLDDEEMREEREKLHEAHLEAARLHGKRTSDLLEMANALKTHHGRVVKERRLLLGHGVKLNSTLIMMSDVIRNPPPNDPRLNEAVLASQPDRIRLASAYSYPHPATQTKATKQGAAGSREHKHEHLTIRLSAHEAEERMLEQQFEMNAAAAKPGYMQERKAHAAAVSKGKGKDKGPAVHVVHTVKPRPAFRGGGGAAPKNKI